MSIIKNKSSLQKRLKSVKFLMNA